MRTYKSKRGMFARHDKKARVPTKGVILTMPETKRYVEWLQNPNGRFLKADAKTEALALDALRVLGCEDEKLYGRAKEYLLTLENPDWGFSSKPGSESSIEGTYHAVSALKKLGVEKKEAADYVLRLHRGNGSFVGDAGAPINNPVNGKVKYTCLAVSALKLLGRDEKDVLARARRFSLRMRHLDNGGFGSSDGIFSDATLENTYYAVKALAELDSLGTIIGEKTANYITGLQNADGGFSPYRPGEISFTSDRMQGATDGKQNKPLMKKKSARSDIQNTFCAISSLDSLGALSKDVRERAGDYVMRLGNHDGSFCHSRSEPGPLGEPPGAGTLLSTAYAVLCLGMVGGEKT